VKPVQGVSVDGAGEVAANNQWADTILPLQRWLLLGSQALAGSAAYMAYVAAALADGLLPKNWRVEC
jgi:hypothetical protein